MTIRVTDKMVLNWALEAWYNENLTIGGLEEIINKLKMECTEAEEEHALDYLLAVVS